MIAICHILFGYCVDWRSSRRPQTWYRRCHQQQQQHWQTTSFPRVIESDWIFDINHSTFAWALKSPHSLYKPHPHVDLIVQSLWTERTLDECTDLIPTLPLLHHRHYHLTPKTWHSQTYHHHHPSSACTHSPHKSHPKSNAPHSPYTIQYTLPLLQEGSISPMGYWDDLAIRLVEDVMFVQWRGCRRGLGMLCWGSRMMVGWWFVCHQWHPLMMEETRRDSLKC
mmetsp:Transcript_19789/g.29793  ORF Transcript_19789/g.29793 Transcript_19789/m.29793 type:complete len:224 (+) Transcript_19789:501-1172(+)